MVLKGFGGSAVGVPATLKFYTLKDADRLRLAVAPNAESKVVLAPEDLVERMTRGV